MCLFLCLSVARRIVPGLTSARLIDAGTASKDGQLAKSASGDEEAEAEAETEAEAEIKTEAEAEIKTEAEGEQRCSREGTLPVLEHDDDARLQTRHKQLQQQAELAAGDCMGYAACTC